MANCYRCGGELPQRVYRNTVCESCGADAKVCLNCTFYDPSAHWECRETIPDPVRDKDRANFCDYFTAGGTGKGSQGVDQKKEDARDALNKLFGDD